MPTQSIPTTVFENPVFTIQEFDVEFENGVKKTFSKLVKSDSVVIVPVTIDKRIVFIREYHAAVNKTFLTLPGGRIDAGEDPESTALRELEEETGYKAAEVAKITELLLSPGYLQQTTYGFMANGLTRTTTKLEETERINVEEHAIGELEQLIEMGELCEARDVALCLMTERLLA